MDDINRFMQWYLKFFPFPYASYSNETNLLLGISKYNAFKLKRGNKTDSVTQASSISSFGYFTLKKQYKFVVESNIMFNKNKSQWKTTLIYKDYPLEFFGKGNDTRLQDQTTLVTTDYQLTSHFLYLVWRKWYVRPMLNLHYYQKVKLECDTTLIKYPSVDFGHNIGLQSAVGVKVLMEGRDNRLNAKKGFTPN